MNFKQLAEQLPTLRSRGPVNVEFVKNAADYLEAYPEGGMRATILDMRSGFGFDADVIHIRVSYEAFDEYNKAFESHNYFDKERNPTLTAREAGYYDVVEELHVMENDDITAYFNLVDSSAIDLFNRYVASGATVTYTQWLEDLVLEHVK